MKWISIRNAWPERSGMYEVKDCREEMYGTTLYDGFNFERWSPHARPLKGGLIHIEYTTTHWRPIEGETYGTHLSEVSSGGSGCLFIPPWDMNEHPEKTEGWFEFQREMRKNPEYRKISD